MSERSLSVEEAMGYSEGTEEGSGIYCSPKKSHSPRSNEAWDLSDSLDTTLCPYGESFSDITLPPLSKQVNAVAPALKSPVALLSPLAVTSSQPDPASPDLTEAAKMRSKAKPAAKSRSKAKPANTQTAAKPKNQYVVNINVTIPDPDVDEIPVSVKLTEAPTAPPTAPVAEETIPAKKPRKQVSRKKPPAVNGKAKEPGKEVSCQTSPVPSAQAASVSPKKTSGKSKRAPGEKNEREKTCMEKLLEENAEWMRKQLENSEKSSESSSDFSFSD